MEDGRRGGKLRPGVSDSIPVATKWLLDAVGDTGRSAIESVFMIVNRTQNTKGTGFLLDTGYLVTNEHVVKGCAASELIMLSSRSTLHSASRVVTDESRDLAALAIDAQGGLKIRREEPQVGLQVATWGYPLGYNGPAPLLAVGHLAGFEASAPAGSGRTTVKRLVVNGAFNGGNSGGPLFAAGSDGVIGVVVSKHAPISPFLASAIKALAANKSGVIFSGTDDKGRSREFVESQLVAEVLYAR